MRSYAFRQRGERSRADGASGSLECNTSLLAVSADDACGDELVIPALMTSSASVRSKVGSWYVALARQYN